MAEREIYQSVFSSLGLRRRRKPNPGQEPVRKQSATFAKAAVAESSRQSAVTDGQASTAQASGKAASGRTSDRKKNNGVIRGLLSGTLISENLILRDMRYSALIALLIIIFIANRFNAERVERQIIVLEEEVSDLRAESLSVSADLGSVSRQSEITDLVKERGLGLEELREPPYRIVVNE